MTPTAETYYLQGKAHQQKQEWAAAINAYKQALELDAESPAKFALEYIYDILDFRHNDLLNP